MKTKRLSRSDRKDKWIRRCKKWLLNPNNLMKDVSSIDLNVFKLFEKLERKYCILFYKYVKERNGVHIIGCKHYITHDGGKMSTFEEEFIKFTKSEGL